MSDINKYFESQAKLSSQPKQNTEKLVLKELPTVVSKKKVKKQLTEHSIPLNNNGRDSHDDASGSEYYPSEDEEEIDLQSPSSSKGTSRVKCSEQLKKSYDDGDMNRFLNRIKEWKATKNIPRIIHSENNANDDSTEKNTQNIFDSIYAEDDYHKLEGGLKIPNFVWNRLYRYQKTGVKWLWELHQMESGGLLGDEMGLGKTVQIIAFMAGLSQIGTGIWGGLGPSIIVAPATVIHQWVMHFHEWFPPLRVAVLHHSGSFEGTPDKLIRDIHSSQGVLITTYVGIVKYHTAIEIRKWHYVILDEGHKIRNSDTQVSKAVKKIRTPHRIVVTGSPMQNSLQELWSLFDFMSPGLLGTLPAFIEHFAVPITQGGYTNATKFQETNALSLAIALKNTISPYMLRRTKIDVKDHLKLPEKKEQVLFCSLADEQKNIYKSYLLSESVRRILDKESRYGDPLRARILVALTTLRKICNHPDLFLCEVDEELPLEESAAIDQSFGFWRRAGKMVVINSLLKIWKKQGHRALIFTQSRAMVCIIEHFLQQNDYKYLKMDGSTGIGSRQPLITAFNSDDSYLVFLATTRVGGLGVNLIGADRVIIYDPDWNPATDSQAKERAWRIGQMRNVTVYRLLSAGTIEEKIYQRQVFKQLLSNKVLLDPNQKNYLKTSTLQGLFSFEEPDKAGSTETANIFKHTKVETTASKEPENKDDLILMNGSVTFSKMKMNAMKRLAQEISKKISSSRVEEIETSSSSNVVHPRIHRKKIEHIQDAVEEPPVNVINDEVTKADFSSVLSEIDIVNMLSKEDNLDFLKPLQPEKSTESVQLDVVSESVSTKDVTNINDPREEGSILVDGSGSHKHRKRKLKKKSKNKLFDERDFNGDEELLQYVKKMKRNKEKIDPDLKEDHDQYVLEKLFAKSGVQNALQHDKVIGLAEREEGHRFQTIAQKNAVHALKALRRSRLKNWRW